MSNRSKEHKLKVAKLLGSSYFLGLGLLNFFATLIYSELHLIDIIILSFGLLPVLIPEKWVLLVFGLIAGFISLYMGFACLMFNLNPEINTSQSSYNMGYLLAASAFTSSLLLVYVGLHWPEKSNKAFVQSL